MQQTEIKVTVVRVRKRYRDKSHEMAEWRQVMRGMRASQSRHQTRTYGRTNGAALGDRISETPEMWGYVPRIGLAQKSSGRRHFEVAIKKRRGGAERNGKKCKVVFFVFVVRQLLIGEKSFEDRIRHRRCAAPPKRDRERAPVGTFIFNVCKVLEVFGTPSPLVRSWY